MEPPDEPRAEKKKKKKRPNKERMEKSRSPESKESPQKGNSKSGKDVFNAKSSDNAEEQNDEVIKGTKIFLEGLKRSRRLSSTWLADYEHDPKNEDPNLPARASFDDHKMVLCETYPAEDSKIYTHEMEFDDDEFNVPTGNMQRPEQVNKEQAKKGKKKGKKKKTTDEAKKALIPEIGPSKSSNDITRDVERNRNSSSEEVNVDSRRTGDQVMGGEHVSRNEKKKRPKKSLSRGKEGSQKEEAVVKIEIPSNTDLAPELEVKESKRSINSKEGKPRTKKRRDTKPNVDHDLKSSLGKEDDLAVKQRTAKTSLASGLEVKESKRSLDLKKESLRKETFNTERATPPRSSSPEMYGRKEQTLKSPHHWEPPGDTTEEDIARKNDTEVWPLVNYRSVFRKFRRNPRKTLCDYKLREIDEICETFFLNKRLLTIGHFPRSPLIKTSLKEIDQFCETMVLTTSNRGSFSQSSVYNKLANYYVSEKTAPTPDRKVKQSFIEYVIYEDVPEIREVTSTDDSQSLKLSPLPAYPRKKIATHLFQRRRYDL